MPPDLKETIFPQEELTYKPSTCAELQAADF